MNEEEKKAIEMLDKFITEHKLYNIKQSDGLEDNIKIVLYLIEKLQKENENFEKLNKDYSYSVDIVRENTRLRRQVFDLEKEQKGADYTTVYLKGVYDERERWELKVKSNIKKYRKLADETYKIFRESNSKDRDSHDAGLYFDGHVSALEEII